MVSGLCLLTCFSLVSFQRSELGRHYKEKTMPSWLVSLLQDSEGVCNKGNEFTEYSISSIVHQQRR
jgi:hypothetical protein